MTATEVEGSPGSTQLRFTITLNQYTQLDISNRHQPVNSI